MSATRRSPGSGLPLGDDLVDNAADLGQLVGQPPVVRGRQPGRHRVWAHGAAKQFFVDKTEAGELRKGATYVGPKQDAANYPGGDVHHFWVEINAAALCRGDLPAFDESLRLFDHDVDVVTGDAAPGEDRR